MRRELLALTVAALVAPLGVDAQRVRAGNADRARDARSTPGVERLEPVHRSGRIVPDRRIVRRAERPTSRVVYRSGWRSRGWDVRHSWVRYDRAGLGIRFHRIGFRDRSLGPRALRDVIGTRGVRMVRDAGRRAGLRGGLRGHWLIEDRFGQVLVVTMGGVDVAEFVDFDFDGFVDDVYLIGVERYRPDRGRW